MASKIVEGFRLQFEKVDLASVVLATRSLGASDASLVLARKRSLWALLIYALLKMRTFLLKVFSTLAHFIVWS